MLVCLDDSDSSRSAVDYVTRCARDWTGLEFHLLHVLDPLPPELREFRGSENPSRETDMEHDLDVADQRWIERASVAAKPFFDAAVASLSGAGVVPGAVKVHCSAPNSATQVAQEILDEARELGCGTVVVGRHAAGWLAEHLGRHVAEDLVREAKNVAVWVVE
jgi:nucleotide-binding universal stress UspA family protein